MLIKSFITNTAMTILDFPVYNGMMRAIIYQSGFNHKQNAPFIGFL